MKYPIFIDTPSGIFRLVQTDFSKGSSCSQCDLFDSGDCHEVRCMEFDNDRHHYHFIHCNEK